MIFALAQQGLALVNVFGLMVFLPLCLAIYYFWGAPKPKTALFIISGLFFLFFAPTQIPFILILLIVNYLIYYKISICKKNNRMLCRLVLLLGIAFNLIVWIVSGIGYSNEGVRFLIGSAVIPFLAIDSLLSHYYSNSTTCPNRDYLIYLCFFPRLFTGPFSSLAKFNGGFEYKFAQSSLPMGSVKFIAGSFQFIFLGSHLIKLAGSIADFNAHDVSFVSSWMMVLSLFMGVYHMLEGSRRVAEGCSNMFGIFDQSHDSYLLTARSFGEGISLIFGTFYSLILRNSELLLQKFYKSQTTAGGKTAKYLSFIVVGVLAGLWLNFSLAFFIFGLVVAALLIIEDLFLIKFLSQIPRWIRFVYTQILLLGCFIVLTVGISSHPDKITRALFGMGIITTNNQSIDLIYSNLIIIFLALILSTGAIENLVKVFLRKFLISSRILSTILFSILYIVLISLILK